MTGLFVDKFGKPGAGASSQNGAIWLKVGTIGVLITTVVEAVEIQPPAS
jgi:hypothetical protein